MTIELVSHDQDLRDVQDLCRSFRRFLYDRYPKHLAIVDLYYDPRGFEDMLSRLPEIHRRPQGAILLARQGGVPAGCVMHHQIAPGVAEMKRLYVSPTARGNGLGAALCQASMARAKADGHRRMRLDTGLGQVEAMGLYRRLGFAEAAPVGGVDAELAPFLVFFEREL